MAKTELVTHSGGFHADELMSAVILTRLFPEATLVRSREREKINPAPGRVVFDVGLIHDPEAGMFDHHQNPAPLRSDGLPYSSFGLVWAWYGERYLRMLEVPEDDIAEIHAAFDADFVLPVDLMDNGALEPSTAGPLLASLTLPALLESLKPVFDDSYADADDHAFAEALAIARAFVEAAIRRKAAKRRAEAIVLAAIARAGSSRVLELPMGMPFRDPLRKAGADHILFVVHPRATDWSLTGIRIHDDSFAQRADLPATWAGLTDAALEAASGVPGARFCHNGRFIAVADSRDAILAMAERAVEAALSTDLAATAQR